MRRYLYLLLCLVLVNFLVLETNAVFTASTAVGSSSWTTGDWTPPSSEITDITGSGSLDPITNLSSFTIHYEAADSGLGVHYVELWYSYNYGEWQYFDNDYPSSAGSFEFDMPEGDGFYEFITVAIDESGNVEDRDGDGENDNANQEALNNAAFSLEEDLWMIEVDTQAPTMNLSLDEFGSDRWAGQDLLINGSFEEGSNAWLTGSLGDHHLVSEGEDDLGDPILPAEGENMFILGFKDASPSDEAIDWLYQDVVLPVNISSSLSFWWRMVSEDTVDYDQFSVWVKDDNNHPLERILTTGSGEIWDISAWDGDSGWQEITHPLVNFAGRPIRIWFELVDKGADDKSWVYIDGVRATTTDNRITEEKEIDFEVHDGSGSGTFEANYEVDGVPFGDYSGVPFTLASGDYDIANSGEDVAGNIESPETDELVVLPPMVINAFSAAPSIGDEWVDLYNNSSSPINVDGWQICDSLNQCQGLSLGNSESGDTWIGSHDSLRFLDNFLLNNLGDTVILKNDMAEEQDRFLYPSFAGDYNWIWQRNPDGIGSWELNKPEIDAHITSRYDEANKILLTIFNIPENYGDGDLIEYEIVYNNGDRGIAGTILAETVENGKADREFYLGTCSAMGVCTPDEVPTREVELTLTQGITVIINQREFGI